jgi:hypothetical protein
MQARRATGRARAWVAVLGSGWARASAEATGHHALGLGRGWASRASGMGLGRQGRAVWAAGEGGGALAEWATVVGRPRKGRRGRSWLGLRAGVGRGVRLGRLRRLRKQSFFYFLPFLFIPIHNYTQKRAMK